MHGRCLRSVYLLSVSCALCETCPLRRTQLSARVLPDPARALSKIRDNTDSLAMPRLTQLSAYESTYFPGPGDPGILLITLDPSNRRIRKILAKYRARWS